MMYRCFLSQGLPALDLSFLLSTGAAGLQGRGIFQHHTEAVRSLWVGAAREVGLRRSELKGYNDTSAQTAPGLTHIQALALRSATANLGSSGSARRHHPGSAAKLRLSSHLSLRLGLRRPRAPFRDLDPFTEATWDPHEKQGVTPARQPCAATLAGTVGRNSGICQSRY